MSEWIVGPPTATGMFWIVVLKKWDNNRPHIEIVMVEDGYTKGPGSSGLGLWWMSSDCFTDIDEQPITHHQVCPAPELP